MGEDMYVLAGEFQRRAEAAEAEVKRLRWAVGVYRDMLRDADALILRLSCEPVQVAA